MRRAVLAVLLLLSAVVLPGGPAVAQPATVPVDGRVTQQLAAAGSATFWVVLDDTADLSGAADLADWGARGRFVVDRLTAHAARTQQPVVDALRPAGARVEAFWAANVLRVTGAKSALDVLTTRADVREIAATGTFSVAPRTTPAAAADGTPEWGVAEIGAPRVWEGGTRGQGVTVGVIDSGVQFDHPALAEAYRGRAADGTVDHDYNWWDPTAICGAAPCDNVGHGTHVTGTVAGADGIGVAPGARFVAAKGCEVDSCSDQALLSSGQWMLAPTDTSGANARPDLRPQVVNSSWSNPAGANTWYRQVVQAWVAAGMFPVFANGNAGPDCRTAGAPASYPESYGVGAYDANGAIADFSSRGSSALDGGTKPDLAAPGVAVRSALPGDTYGYGDGTSMAAPHVTGAVALLLSAAPVLRGETDLVRAALDRTARAAEDLTCGGVPGDDNVFGEGKLDAAALVAGAPHGEAGIVTGLVTADGAPVAGAEVAVPAATPALTGADGRYRLAATAGTAELTVRAFGYARATATTTVPADGTATADVTLTALPRFTVTGTVVDAAGDPLGGVEVRLRAAPLPPVTTGADGTFAIADVPSGAHTVTVPATACTNEATTEVTVDGDETVALTASRRVDDRGYGCHLEAPAFRTTGTVLPINGDRTSYLAALPFTTRLYGTAADRVRIFVDGRIGVGATTQTVVLPEPVPSAAAPNASLYPYWADLYVDAAASVRTAVHGTAPHREFVVEWRNVQLRDGALREPAAGRVTVQAVLGEDGSVRYQYAGLETDAERGGGTNFVDVLTGIEDESGATAIQYSHNRPLLSDEHAIVFDAPAAGSVSGRLTDGNDGLAIGTAQNAAITATAADGTTLTHPVTDGAYTFVLPAGEYTLTATGNHYGAATRAVTVTEDRALSGVDLALPTGRVVFSGQPIVLRAGASPVFTYDLPVTNTGTLQAETQVYLNYPRPSWLTMPGSVPTLEPGERDVIRLSVDATGLAAGEHTARFNVMPFTGRDKDVWIPVTLVVPAYQVAVDAGGPGLGTWSADRAYRAGWGYEDTGTRVVTTRKAIAGTEEDDLYRTARAGNQTYRFTGLPDGTYRADLSFAEIEGATARQRRVDVTADGQTVHAALDIAALAGRDTALDRSFTVVVDDGELRLSLTARTGSLRPLLAGLRLTHVGA